MNGYFYCFLVVCITPTAMAITCYVCAPQLSDLSVDNCKEPKNVIDCDKETPPAGMKYDSCFSIIAKVEQGTEVTQRFCGIKALCSQEAYCDSTRQSFEAENQTMTTCKLECCDGDKCNTGAGYVNAASLTITMVTAIVSLIVSFY